MPVQWQGKPKANLHCKSATSFFFRRLRWHPLLGGLAIYLVKPRKTWPSNNKKTKWENKGRKEHKYNLRNEYYSSNRFRVENTQPD